MPESRDRAASQSAGAADAASGHFDLAIGAVVGTLLDPSDSFSAWYGKDGPQNYSFWDNTEFQALTAQIDRELDTAKRLPLVHQAEAIMEQDPPAATGRLGADQRSGITMLRGSIPMRISASSMSDGWIRSGLIRAEVRACGCIKHISVEYLCVPIMPSERSADGDRRAK